MIDWLEALVLGIVQGATEYLPVSSSGHLVIFQHLFGHDEPAILFDVVLHVATLLVVLGFYRRDIVDLVQQSSKALGDLIGGKGWSEVQRLYPGFRLAWMIVLGTIPTAVIGISLQETFEEFFGSLRIVGVMLWLTGVILLATLLARRSRRGIEAMKPIDALLIGLVQGLAITPGISRSGATIGVALLLGIEKKTAARYSFLLSVPSIVGALILKLGDPGGEVGIGAMSVGFLAALVVGTFCLALLVRLVNHGKLAWFAPYCFVAGLLAWVLAHAQS